MNGNGDEDVASWLLCGRRRLMVNKPQLATNGGNETIKESEFHHLQPAATSRLCVLKKTISLLIAPPSYVL